MRTREFPALGPEDAPVVEAFGVGLGREEARVLAFLLLRGDDRPASRLDVRIGAGLGRERTADALSALETVGLVASGTIDSGSSGRPQKGWRVAGDPEEIAARVRQRHAEALLGQARTVAAEVGSGAAGGDRQNGEADTLPVALDRGAADPARVVLNWIPNGFHAPVFLAAERGFYGEAGVDASIRAARGSTAALRQVESGGADVGVVGSAVLCGALAEGRPVVPVALLYQRAMTVLYSVRSVFGAELDSVEQLRGRTVAMPRGSETALLARLFLSQAGVLGDVTIVDASGEERADLLEGKADVVTGMAADPPALEAEGYTVDSILVSEKFPVPGPALVVHADALADPPAALGGFLTATMRGVVAADRDREAAAEAVAARSDHAVAAERRRLDVALDRFSDSEARRSRGWGWQSVDDWRRLRMALHQTGTLSGQSG
ncbi:myristoyl transferase [Halobacteriales archaeon SW_10_68_16]|jgi:ABC-type nitrate/sulfonate/bicarbonate transport system substrate-binding protein|nr:MAG: myristoyl transferase [Halobacteriales archaeon SW_10_68_16]